MTLNCKEIDSVVIDGDNYGGKLYDLKVDVGFNSPTVFTASFVSEDGQYSINYSDLNAEVPSTLNFVGKNFHIYPVSYKKTFSAGGWLLVVKFLDSSHKYMDKFMVVPKTTQRVGYNGEYYSEKLTGERFINVVPMERKDSDVELGKYTPAELLKGMEKIPMTSRVRGLLEGFEMIKEGPRYSDEDDPRHGAHGIFMDTVGTLRDALSSLGGQLGYTFFWDWSLGEEGRLDVMDAASRASAIGLKDTLLGKYRAKMSSKDESFSIEDNYMCADIIYDVNGGSSGETQNVSNKRIYYAFLDITRDNFWVRPPRPGETVKNKETGDGETYYFKRGELLLGETKEGGYEWLKMCAAALMGEEYFNRYIHWNIAARETFREKYGLRYRNSRKKVDTPKRPLETPKNGYNKLLIKTIEGGYRANLLFQKRRDETLAEMISELRTLKCAGHAGWAEKLIGKGDFPIEDVYKIFGENLDKTKVAEESEDSKNKRWSIVSPLPYWGILIQKSSAWEDVVSQLYETCLLFGKNYKKWAISCKRGLKEGTLSRFENLLREITRADAKNYSPDMGWVWKKADASDGSCFLSDLVEYKMSSERSSKLAEIDLDEEVRVSVESWLKDFSLVNDAEDSDEYLDQNFSDDNELESEELKQRGYSVIDWAGERRPVKLSKPLEYWVPEERWEESITDSWKTQKTIPKYAIIRADGLIEAELMGAVKKFFFYESKGGRMDKRQSKYREYRKVTTNDSVAYYNMKQRAFWQNMSHPKAVSNTIEIQKAPQVEGYIFNLKEWERLIKQYKWLSNEELNANVAYNFVIEDLVPISTGWIRKGLESYSLSYSGDGVTTTITVGNRKKQRQTIENLARSIKTSPGENINIKTVRQIRPSSAASTAYGMKAFS